MWEREVDQLPPTEKWLSAQPFQGAYASDMMDVPAYASDVMDVLCP